MQSSFKEIPFTGILRVEKIQQLNKSYEFVSLKLFYVKNFEALPVKRTSGQCIAWLYSAESLAIPKTFIRNNTN